jgi:hypothetical protein
MHMQVPPLPPEDWGNPWEDQDWDPATGITDDQLEQIANEAEEDFRRVPGQETPRDKWITPLLDFKSVGGAVDPDQGRGGTGLIVW